jgi:hypothetical protein
MKSKKKKLKTIKQSLTSDGKKLTSDGKKLTSDGKKLTSDGKKLTSDGKKLTSDGKNRSRKRFNRRFTQRAGAETQVNVPSDEPKQKSRGKLATAMKHEDTAFRKGWIETKEEAKEAYEDVGSSISRKGASFMKEGSNYMKKLKGEAVDSCSLVKDKLGAELYSDRHAEISRKTENHPFFKDEDDYFKSLVKRNMNQFCFKTRVGNDAEYYSRFCRSVLTCMKTPKQLPQLLFEAIDAKATKRMFDELPGKYNPSNDKTEGLKGNIVNRIMKENTDISEEKNAKQRFAMILSVLQNENKKTLSIFIVDVLIKTIIDYKKASSSAPSSYKGNITLQLYVDNLIKRLTKDIPADNAGNGGNAEPAKPADPAKPAGNAGNGGNGDQVGGSGIEKENTLMTSAELEKVGVEELYEGMLRCNTKDLIKAEYEASTENADLFEDADIEIDGLSESLESPKLLYIVIGSLALVSLIELGLFDAPECLTHTFL